MRAGEKDGVTYHFRTDEEFERARREGRIIESRDYTVVSGVWHYYTEDDGQIDLTSRSYLLIGTLESYCSFCSYYGKDNVVPLYVELEAGERLQRALDREKEKPGRDIKSCAGDFLPMKRTFPRRSSWRQGFANDLRTKIWRAVLKRYGRKYVRNRI